MNVSIKRIDTSLELPKYQTGGSVGFDFLARIETIIASKSLARVPANVIIQIPSGYSLLIFARSSLAFKKGLMLANSVGVVDQDFCGPEDEIQIALYNFTDTPVTIQKGDRLAQGLFVPIGVAHFQEVQLIEKPSRGGFGSTG